MMIMNLDDYVITLKSGLNMTDIRLNRQFIKNEITLTELSRHFTNHKSYFEFFYYKMFK